MSYRERVLAAMVLGLWGAYVAGRLLLAAHAFRWWVVLPLGISALWVLRRRLPWPPVAPPVPRAFAAALAAVVLLLVARLLKGLASPPLGWDALTYHLFKAGRMASLGFAPFEAAPDAWGYYESFPAAGSVLYAVGFLFAPDGALVPVLGTAFGALAAVAVLVLARRLGAPEGAAGAAALTMAATPALASILTAGYVDVLVAGAVLAAAALAPFRGDPQPRVRAAIAGAACGLAAAAKTSAVVPAAALGAAIAAGSPVAGAIFVAAAGATALPEYLGPWLRTGNPLYPFGATVGGRALLEGNYQLAAMLSGKLFAGGDTAASLGALAGWIGGVARRARTDFAGLGVGALPVVALAAAGFAALFSRRESRGRAFGLLLVAALPLVALFSEGNRALWTKWAYVLGRHLLPVWGIALAAAAAAPWRVARRVWPAVLAAGIGMSLPLGWGRADTIGALILAAAAIAAGGGAWLLRRPRLAPAAALVAVAVALVPVRAHARNAVWGEAAAPGGGPYDYHFLDPAAMPARGMWTRLDDLPPSRIAAICGWDGLGHSCYLYPLLGARLQHEVVYVPPTADGKVVNYASPRTLERAADRDAWVRRLVERGVERVAVMPPSTPESRAFIPALPELFELEWADPATGHALYRFDRERARARGRG